mgnify:CR=1 FL=1
MLNIEWQTRRDSVRVDLLGIEAFGLDEDELQALVDPVRFVGRAPEQVARFLDTTVAPVLERLSQEAQELQKAELHV